MMAAFGQAVQASEPVADADVVAGHGEVRYYVRNSAGRQKSDELCWFCAVLI
jgi:hypothetical protein